MNQYILWAIAVLTLTSVTIAADIQSPSEKDPVAVNPESPTNKETVKRLSPKEAKRPAPLNFPKDFGSTLDTTESDLSDEDQGNPSAPLNFPESNLLSDIKRTTVQLSIHGKQLALRLFTKENARIAQVYLNKSVDCLITLVAIMAVFSYDSMIWVFDTLTSLRFTPSTQKDPEKTH